MTNRDPMTEQKSGHKGISPVIDEDRCIGCNRCVENCVSSVFELQDGKAYAVRGNWCIACGHCTAVCPVDAVSHPSASDHSALVLSPNPAVDAEALQLLLRERRSVRRYKRQALPRELIEKILEAGRYTPTGTNSQNVRYLVITQPDEIDRLRRSTMKFYQTLFGRLENPVFKFLISLFAGKQTVAQLTEYIPKIKHAKELIDRGQDRLFYDAPAIIIVHAEKSDSCSAFNCATALFSCSLKAHSLGVGCCFNGFLENAVNHEASLKRQLEIPPHHRCFGAMTMGFQDVNYRRLVARKPCSVVWR